MDTFVTTLVKAFTMKSKTLCTPCTYFCFPTTLITHCILPWDGDSFPPEALESIMVLMVTDNARTRQLDTCPIFIYISLKSLVIAS